MPCQILIFQTPVASSAMLTVVLCASTDARRRVRRHDGPRQADSTTAAPRTLLNGAVRMRTLTDAGDTTINEYASSTGQIFAYTWQGPTMPDLRRCSARTTPPTGRAPPTLAAGQDLHASRVARPDVVVESGGQMRSYVGRAWLPGGLAAGVTPPICPEATRTPSCKRLDDRCRLP